MAAASQARRRRPDLDIVALERGRWTSYSACGIPYVVGGQVESLDNLIARTPQQFRDRLGIDVRMRHEAVGVDLGKREVEVRDHEHRRTYRVGFDQLLFGTGARPLKPDLPGIDGDQVHGVQTLEDAQDLLTHAQRIEPTRVAVVGGGYIGLEIAEAFLQRGAQVTVLERSPQVMRTLDPDMGALVSDAMREHGIDVRCGTEVTGFEKGLVRTEQGDVETDLVVLGLGVRPNSELAADAGVALGAGGAIGVDRRQHTDLDGVWAAGDCCESFHLVSQRKVYIALGTVANKQSRVAGINIAGGYATFPGVVGTAVSKICSTEVARTGLGEAEAAAAGFAATAFTAESTTRAGYYPGASPIRVKLVVEDGSGRVLGGQIVGREGAAKRIDVLATAITARMTVRDLIDLDLSYAPPFSPVWDPVQVAARVALRSGDGAR